MGCCFLLLCPFPNLVSSQVAEAPTCWGASTIWRSCYLGRCQSQQEHRQVVDAPQHVGVPCPQRMLAYRAAFGRYRPPAGLTGGTRLTGLLWTLKSTARFFTLCRRSGCSGRSSFPRPCSARRNSGSASFSLPRLYRSSASLLTLLHNRASTIWRCSW